MGPGTHGKAVPGADFMVLGESELAENTELSTSKCQVIFFTVKRRRKIGRK